ncbi:trypsin-like peptidase domain-containing protein [Legionella pneumophila serogroup 7]|nr:trypsin-like peptidase domain-containing protein [Legionella pneumophila subsp. fraseri]MDX1846435.1 trypsin-like peptidase domain-containing protein [Legionella pneumophila subsp. fraseri]
MPNDKMDIDEGSKDKNDLKKSKKVQQSETETSHPYPDSKTTKEFTAHDFSFLAENEHFRYAPNSEKIGHAVITKEDDKTVALQYELPQGENEETPKVRPLINIEAIQPFRGMHRFRAQTPDGHTPMYGKRSIYGKVGEKEDEDPIQIVCFSPSPEEGKQPFWGSIKETPLFSDKLKKSAKKELEKELAEIGQVTKGGSELEIDHDSVPQRDLIKTRTPDQNTVMGESARDAYEHFFEKMSDELHPDMKARLKRAFEADIKDNFFKNSYRPEWLHLYGWSLMPMDKDPQKKENLGAAPKWANTQMMILERTVKWFAINAPESLLTIKPKFEMLLDSELVKHIDFSVRVKIKERYVELMQKIDPFLAYPLFAKASDLAQGTAITYNILNKIEPVSKQVVKGNKSKGDEGLATVSSKKAGSILTKTQAAKRHTETTSTSHQDASLTKAVGGKRKRDSEMEDESVIAPSKPKTASSQSDDLNRKRRRDEDDAELEMSAPKSKRAAHEDQVMKSKHKTAPDKSSSSNGKKRRREEDSDDEDMRETPKKRIKFPTQNQHELSVVQIYSDFFVADYDNPWRGPESSSCSGSGFIVQDPSSGKKYIMTNAHVAENTTFLQVRLANNRIKKYEAKVKCVSYQCDLALLEVEDPEFNDLVEPVELGEMVSLRDRIMVVGFPMGGTEISLSKGIVSRIQVDGYSMSGQNLLQAQVDAAVNPGNSGGPVFIGEKVVGVAFQGYGGHQGLSYIIPIPIMRHFLTEALSGKPYRGFPSIPIVTEEIENPSEREFYKMGKKSGIRVLKVDNLSDAYTKLKPDDIILAIDGLPISNEGTVDIPGIGNCIDYFHVTQSKFIGDSVRLNILRRKPDTDAVEELEVDVILDTILGDTEKVSVPEHDKMPTYYINSGICFVPLTRNYMEGNGCDFEEMHLVEENCSLPDAPKKKPNEQIVVINTILNCKETQGYEKHIRGIVKEVNGQPINNIHDVVRAMEGNKEKRHVISLASKSKIVIPNMSAEEHAKLLKRNHIAHDRSTDLSDKMLVDEELEVFSHIPAPKKSELYVEEMELTQSGMHALFARMGYSEMVSASIYNGNLTLNLDALNRQGFMPVLTDVGESKVSGHWIMLIRGRDNQYFIFDPIGQTSGNKYVTSLASQLPTGATLSVIPNAEGFNRGLCGYWVASTGIRAYAALNQATPPSLATLGQIISYEMQAELANNGFMKIITWLQSVAEKFSGSPAKKPIDARELRLASEAPLKSHPEIVCPIPIRPSSSSFFNQLPKETEEKIAKPKRRRFIIESDEEEGASIFSGKEKEDVGLTQDMLPGLKRWQQKIVEMEEKYKDLPEDEEDDEYYANSSDNSEGSDEEETESEDRSEDLEEEDSETEEESIDVKPKNKASKKAQHHNPRLERHGFFKRPAEDDEMEHQHNTKRARYK